MNTFYFQGVYFRVSISVVKITEQEIKKIENKMFDYLMQLLFFFHEMG